MSSSDRFRWLGARLPRPDARRLVVVTGARQTGKTTLARARYPDLAYRNLDDLALRQTLRDLPAARWHRDVGAAVLDEAQKEPAVFEKVKFAFDGGELDFSVLLGSSRILLMGQVRETLAGRAFVFDLWPLMPSEVRQAADARPEPPLLDALLDPSRLPEAVLAEVPPLLLPDAEDAQRSAFGHVLQWGGMPELLRLSDDDRHQWLRSYQQTFLERDLLDLARLHDLEPFAALQQLCMLRTGGLLSFAELARDAKIGVATTRRYLEYLRMSYQVLLLPPYARNLTSSVVKSPKLYWVDQGLLRQGTRQWGSTTGAMFETIVVTEVHKWISTMGRDVGMTFYRTRSGMEVDLLLDNGQGLLGVEIKQRDHPLADDLRSLRAVARQSGEQWRGGVLVYDGSRVEEMDRDARIWAVPAHRLFA